MLAFKTTKASKRSSSKTNIYYSKHGWTRAIQDPNLKLRWLRTDLREESAKHNKKFDILDILLMSANLILLMPVIICALVESRWFVMMKLLSIIAVSRSWERSWWVSLKLHWYKPKKSKRKFNGFKIPTQSFVWSGIKGTCGWIFAENTCFLIQCQQSCR